MAESVMPGPGVLRSLWLAREYRKNYIVPLKAMFQEFGDYVLAARRPPVILVFHPLGVEHVLKTNAKNYRKSPNIDELRPMLGLGLLTSEGEMWKEHRRLIGPEFQHKKLLGFYPVIEKHLRKMLESWRVVRDPFDVAPALSKMTYGIAGECFFGADVENSSAVVYQSIERSSRAAVQRMTGIIRLPRAVPLPSNIRARRAVREMDEVVYRIIDDRIKNPSTAEDVLSRLIRLNRDSGEPVLSRTQIRDEVMTLLLAGHETTANALAWALFLLGRNPDIQERLRDELGAAICGDVPTIAEVAKLKYAKMVFEESMRMYPPVAAIGRQPIEADEIGGYPVAPGTIVNLAPWVTHHHPEFWSEPEKFNPERFADPSAHHPFAYFPFALGPRECVGKNMAMMEGLAILAALVKNFRFELCDPNVTPQALITVRPVPGVIMRVRRTLVI